MGGGGEGLRKKKEGGVEGGGVGRRGRRSRRRRGRLWPQAEVLITVLAREQKAEGGKDGGTLGPD